MVIMKENKRPTFLNYLAPLVMISIGSLHYLKHGLDLTVVVLFGMGILALYLALFNHYLLQRILTFLTLLWFPVGQLITIILLTVTFFIIFAPVGLILRVFKNDILNKKFRIDRLSYWLDRSKAQENNYTQQF